MINKKSFPSNVIKVKTGDSNFWDAAVATAEIVSKLNHYDKIVIDFDSEAPDIHTTDLVKVLDYLHSIGIKKNQIEIVTGNMVESYNKFQITKKSEWMYELPLFQSIAENIDKQKNIQKHFGCFIGRSNINRLLIASHLYAKYSDKTMLTYHFTPCDDFHRVHTGLEDVLYHYGPNSDEFNHAVALIKKSPIKNDQVTYTYPIDKNYNIKICNWYKHIFVDVVCETFSNGNVFNLTEKFWRSVATKTPFIIQGSQFTLKRLKQLGFKTFDCWWDEGYDEDYYLHSQKEIKKVLNHLDKFTVNQLTTMHAEMQSVLDNNYDCMMNLNFKDLMTVI